MPEFFTELDAGDPLTALTFNDVFNDLNDGIVQATNGTRDNPIVKAVEVQALTLNLRSTSSLTIASGVITITRTRHLIDTEAAAASDNLDTINGGADGDLLVLQPANASRDVVLRHNVGNIWLADEQNFTLATTSAVIVLMYHSTLSLWVEVRSSSKSTAYQQNHPYAYASAPTSTTQAVTLRLPYMGSEQLATGDVLLDYQTRMGRRMVWGYHAANASLIAMNTIAHTLAGSALTGAGATSARRHHVRFASASGAGNPAGLSQTAGTSSTTAFPVPLTDQVRFDCVMFVDDIADIRIWVGMSSLQFGPGNADTTANDFAGFRFSTVAGDTNWMFTSRNGGSGAITDSGVAVSVNTEYTLSALLDTAASANTWRFFINGVFVGSGTAATYTTNPVQIVFILYSQSGIATMGLNRFIVEND